MHLCLMRNFALFMYITNSIVEWIKNKNHRNEQKLDDHHHFMSIVITILVIANDCKYIPHWLHPDHLTQQCWDLSDLPNSQSCFRHHCILS